MPDAVDERVAGLAVYRRDGEAGAAEVVTIHGSMDRGAAFLKLVRRLRDLTTVRYDRRGYGRSLEAGTCETFDEQVDDLVAVQGDRPAVLVGHSYGAVIALAAATRRPDDVLGVLAIEPPMPWAPWWPSTSAGGQATAAAADGAGPEAAAERFMRRIVGDAIWEGLPERTQAQRRAEGAALVAELQAMRSTARPYEPARLTMPVVAVYGDRTSDRHRRAVETLVDELPHAELLVVAGAGHGLHASQPEALVGAVRRLAERG